MFQIKDKMYDLIESNISCQQKFNKIIHGKILLAIMEHTSGTNSINLCSNQQI